MDRLRASEADRGRTAPHSPRITVAYPTAAGNAVLHDDGRAHGKNHDSGSPARQGEWDGMRYIEAPPSIPSPNRVPPASQQPPGLPMEHVLRGVGGGGAPLSDEFTERTPPPPPIARLCVWVRSIGVCMGVL